MSTYGFHQLIASLMFCIMCVLSDPPKTRIAQGRLEGMWVTTRGGRRVAAFLSIPFAQPPLGSLRFQSPRPAKPWGDTVYKADSAPPLCIQTVSNTSSEDCLYLNVFTPNVKPQQSYAVFVYIYGGAFRIGSASPTILGPQYLLDEDIILVTMNYRLGILGFLSLEHPVLPGNLGLKDQREALRWVKKNIAAFGGDPDKVTIGGNSSGGVCAHLLSMFAAKEGLFRAAILDSKTALANSGFQLPGAQRHYVELIAENTKCPREPTAFVDCLRELPAQEFIRLIEIIKVGLIPSLIKLGALVPVIEPPTTPDRLVSADPILLNTHLPLFVTNTEKEGLLFTKPIFQDKTNQSLKAFNSNPTILLPYYLQFDDTAKCSESVAKTVIRFYLQDKPINRENFLRFVDMFSDAHYTYGTVLTSRANKNVTFFSRLIFRGLTVSSSDDYYFGVSHAENLLYIFPYEAVRNITITHPDDIRFSKLYVKLWTNFVKFLNPTPEGYPVNWTPVKNKNIQYLEISNNTFVMKDNYLGNRIAFWDFLPYRNKYSEPQDCKNRYRSIRKKNTNIK